MAHIIKNDPVIDEILNAFRAELGLHYQKYHNHVYRVFNLTLILNGSKPINEKALPIAAAFHDLGIWTAKTFNYLSPSVELAKTYLQKHGISNLERRVTDIINNHHKLSTYKGDAITESFRKADFVDLSFSLISFGVNKETLKELNTEFPSLGFHRFIVKQAIKNTLRHPLNPLPMMKW